MHPISSVLRIVCGAAILILCITTYNKFSASIAAGETFQVLGYTMTAGWQAPAMLALIGLIGVIFAIGGVMGLLKGRR